LPGAWKPACRRQGSSSAFNQKGSRLTGAQSDPPPGSSRWTVLPTLRWTTDFLRGKGVEEPRLDAELLLADVLGCERIDLYCRFDKPLTPEERGAYREAVKRRARREPVAYIVGRREFMSLSFRVTQDTLIPRPETEILVESVLDRVDRARQARVLDIGAGAGVIAVVLAREIPAGTVIATDRSFRALQVAKENAAALDVAERVHFHCADALVAPWRQTAFDIVACNPPYLSESEWRQSAPEIRLFEPRGALAAGPNGTEMIFRMIETSRAILKAGGLLAVEMGAGQAEEARAHAEAAPWLTEIETQRDYQGIERVLLARGK